MRVFLWALALALALVSPVVFADDAARPEPSAEDRATARALLDEGDALVQKNDFRAALDKYKTADEIMGVPTTGIALAQVQAKLLLLVEAADTAARVQRYPVKAGEPEAFTSARNLATALLDDVNARIPTLLIVVSGDMPAAISVKLDGHELSPSTRFLKRKTNPGAHEVVIEAPGKRGTAAFELSEKDVRTVEVALEEEKPAAPAAPPKLTVVVPPLVTPQEAPPAHVSPGVWIGLGVAGAGLVLGAITGGVALARNSTLTDPKNCGPEKQCASDDAQAALDQSYRLANASTACFAVAGAGGIVALTAWLVTRTPKEPFRRDALEPLAAPGYLGVRGSF